MLQTSLNDITKLDWLNPNKSDKGAIILHIIGNFNLILWSKENLIEWMLMLRESIERYRIRKTCVVQNSNSKTISNLDTIPLQPPRLGLNNNEENNDFYENTANILENGQSYKQSDNNNQDYRNGTANKVEQKPFNHSNGKNQKQQRQREFCHEMIENSKDNQLSSSLSSSENRSR